MRDRIKKAYDWYRENYLFVCGFAAWIMYLYVTPWIFTFHWFGDGFVGMLAFITVWLPLTYVVGDLVMHGVFRKMMRERIEKEAAIEKAMVDGYNEVLKEMRKS